MQYRTVLFLFVLFAFQSMASYAQQGVRELVPNAAGMMDAEEWQKHLVLVERSPNMVGADRTVVPVSDTGAVPVVTTPRHRWHGLGPFYTPDMAGSGRTSAIAINPRLTTTMIRATASGGLWKSVDDGASWYALTDGLPTTGTSDVVYDPSDTAVVYLATGDSWRWTYTSHGIYRSTDGGETWTSWARLWSTELAPWGGFYGIRRIVVNPSAGRNVIVATNDGLFTTIDGGATWTHAFPNMMFDALEMHSFAHDVVFAGNGDGNADNGILFRSLDRGRTWAPCSTGLTGRSGMRTYVCPSPADSTLVYAVIHDDWTPAHIYTSRDTGATWTHVHDTTIFFNEVAADPFDAATIYGSSFENWVSHDGGRTWDTLNSQRTVHCDHWQTTFDADGTIYDCTDGGVWRRRRGASSWENMNTTVCAFEYYDMHSAQRDTIHIMTGSQDNTGQYRFAVSPTGWKHGIFHGDAMICAVDPDDPSIVYSEGIGGSMFRSNDACSTWVGIRPQAVRDGNWVTPFVMDKSDARVLYMGFQELWRSSDKGGTWTKLVDSVGSGENIDHIALCTSNRFAIVIAQGDHLHRSTDGGKTWRRCTAFDTLSTNPHSAITDICVRDNDANEIWITCDGYGKGGKVFRSRDAGVTWTDMTAALPNPQSYHAVALATDALHTTYVGSRSDVFVRNDTTKGWYRYDVGLPNVMITDLELLESFGKLRACTWGRGIWETSVWNGSVVSVPADRSFEEGVRVRYVASEHRLEVDDPLQRAWSSMELYDVLGHCIATAASDGVVQVPHGPYVVRLVGRSNHTTTMVLIW